MFSRSFVGNFSHFFNIPKSLSESVESIEYDLNENEILSPKDLSPKSPRNDDDDDYRKTSPSPRHFDKINNSPNDVHHHEIENQMSIALIKRQKIAADSELLQSFNLYRQLHTSEDSDEISPQLKKLIHRLTTHRASDINRAINSLSLKLIDSRSYKKEMEMLIITTSVKDELNDKQRNHLLLIDMLHDYSLLQDALITDETLNTLSTHSQLLSATIHFLDQLTVAQSKSSKEREQIRNEVVLSVMKQSIEIRGDSDLLKEGITLLDLFLSRVSQLPIALSAMIQTLSRQVVLKTDEVKVKVRKVTMLIEASRLLLGILQTARKQRINLAQTYELNECGQWIHSPEIRSILRKHVITLSSTVHLIVSQKALNSQRIELFRQLHELCHLTMSEYSVTDMSDEDYIDEYRNDRLLCTSKLRSCCPIDLGTSIETVFAFAEQFRDFESLVQLCDSLPNAKLTTSRLVSEMETFGQKFADALFKLYCQQKKEAMLFTINQPKEYNTWLDTFLNDRKSLSWVQKLTLKDFASASDILYDLSLIETNFYRSNQLASLSKLSMLSASEDQHDDSRFDEINVVLAKSQARAFLSKHNLNEIQPLKRRTTVVKLPQTQLFYDLLSAARQFSKHNSVDDMQQCFIHTFKILNTITIEREFAQCLRQLIISMVQVDEELILQTSKLSETSVNENWKLQCKNFTFVKLWPHLSRFIEAKTAENTFKQIVSPIGKTSLKSHSSESTNLDEIPNEMNSTSVSHVLQSAFAFAHQNYETEKE